MLLPLLGEVLLRVDQAAVVVVMGFLVELVVLFGDSQVEEAFADVLVHLLSVGHQGGLLEVLKGRLGLFDRLRILLAVEGVGGEQQVDLAHEAVDGLIVLVGGEHLVGDLQVVGAIVEVVFAAQVVGVGEQDAGLEERRALDAD